MRITISFTYLLCILFIFIESPISSQSYSEYTDSYLGELSFEAKIEYNKTEIHAIENYFANYAPVTKDLRAIYLDLLQGFTVDVIEEKSYLDSREITCEEIRLCPEIFDTLSPARQSEYLLVLEYLQNNYAFSQEELSAIRGELIALEGLLSPSLESVRIKLFQYLSLVEQLQYTKLEVFRDFTGYCDVIDYLALLTLDPENSRPLAFARGKQGLTNVDAIIRLLDISYCYYGAGTLGLVVNYNNNHQASKGTLFKHSFDSLTEERMDINRFSVVKNPSVGRFIFNLDLTKPNLVEITIYDLTGGKVENIVSSKFDSGNYIFTWNMGNNTNRVYICHAKVGNEVKVLKLVGRQN